MGSETGEWAKISGGDGRGWKKNSGELAGEDKDDGVDSSREDDGSLALGAAMADVIGGTVMKTGGEDNRGLRRGFVDGGEDDRSRDWKVEAGGGARVLAGAVVLGTKPEKTKTVRKWWSQESLTVERMGGAGACGGRRRRRRRKWPVEGDEGASHGARDCWQWRKRVETLQSLEKMNSTGKEN